MCHEGVFPGACFTGRARLGHAFCVTSVTRAAFDQIPERVAEAFPEIGISIDSLDQSEAERIGRVQLDRVLRNLDRLLESMPASRVGIHTVGLGQSLDAIRMFEAEKGMRHLVQPLQRKEDYRSYMQPLSGV